jgi:YidC/Oxa1 family membrane protein insertase
MDRKGILLLGASLCVLALWFPLVNRLFPPQPAPVRTNLLANASALATTNANVSAPAPTGSVRTAGPVADSGPSGGPWRVATGAVSRVEFETPEARYVFSSLGGGLESVELRGYPEQVACGRRRDVTTNVWAKLNHWAPLPVLSLLGGEAIEGDGQFTLIRQPDGVRAEKNLPGGLRVVKTFSLGSNHMLRAHARLENTGAGAMVLPEQKWVVGTAAPISTNDNPQFVGVFIYDGAKAHHVTEPWYENRTLGCIPGTRRDIYLSGPERVLWTAAHSQFFTLIVTPATNGPAPRAEARRLELPAPGTTNGAAMNGRRPPLLAYETTLAYPALTLTPGQAVEQVFEIYAGPREYNMLARLGGNQDLVMDFGTFFGFFAKALLLGMNGLHALGLSYGLTIIVITVIVKLLFWPLTQASTRSMKRMGELQPQMKAIQEKYKDDPKKMNLKLMEFMRENRVSPVGGCLPILIQIPVFIGFYQMLQSAIELRGARFLWICDLSQPDTVLTIPGLGWPLNPLPILMAVTQLWQTHLTPPAPGVDPMQQKIMKYMPLMFLVILYNFSAGLALYWTVQNLLTIAQMKLTKSTAPAAVAPAPAAAGRGGHHGKRKK